MAGRWKPGPLVRPTEIDGLSDDPLDRETLREVRALLGVSQSGLAEMVGVSLRTVKAWEHPHPDSSEARPCSGPARRLVRLLVRRPELAEEV